MANSIGTTDQRTSSSGQGTSSSGQGAARAKFDEAATSAKSVSEQALSTGRELADKAKDFAESSTGTIKGQASDLVDAAKDVASQATDKIKEAVSGQQASGAEYVGNLAETIRRAAREFEADLPIAATYMRKAASQVEGVSDKIRSGNLEDVVRTAQSFARRQPTAFLGMAVLAGFGAVRFLKSSSEAARSSESVRSSHREAGDGAQNLREWTEGQYPGGPR